MQGYLTTSPTLMMKFAKQLSDAQRCPHCGQRFQLCFSGGRLTDRKCGCDLVYVVGTTPDKYLGDDADAPHAMAADVTELRE
jgi:hypothetical protein